MSSSNSPTIRTHTELLPNRQLNSTQENYKHNKQQNIFVNNRINHHQTMQDSMSNRYNDSDSDDSDIDWSRESQRPPPQPQPSAWYGNNPPPPPPPPPGPFTNRTWRSSLKKLDMPIDKEEEQDSSSIITDDIAIREAQEEEWRRKMEETRVENPQYSFGTLPEHVLVDIFNFLNPYQSYSGAIRIRRLDTYGNHGDYTTNRVKRREKTQVKKEDEKQKNDLGLVCRNWRDAACNDLLWKSQAVYLHKQLCVKIKRGKNDIFQGKTARSHFTYSHTTYPDRPINRNCISLKDLDLSQIPRKDFKDHYFELVKQREKYVNYRERKERRDTFIANVLRRAQYFSELYLRVASYGVVYFMLLMQLALVIIHWFLDMGDHTYVYFLSPLLFVAVYLTFGVPFFIYLFIALHSHELPSDGFIKLLIAGVAALSWFECMPLVLIVMNLGILPRFHTQLYHVESIPWPAVFAPWFLTLFVLAAAVVVANIISIASSVRSGVYTLSDKLFGEHESKTFRWSMLGAYALFSFGLFFVLLGFTLEFYNHFFIPLAFIPMLLMQVIAQGPLGYWGWYEKKSTYSSKKDKFLTWNILIFPSVLTICEIPCCFAQFIGPFCFIGPMIVLTQVYNMANILIASSSKTYSWMNDGGKKYTLREVLLCEENMTDQHHNVRQYHFGR